MLELILLTHFFLLLVGSEIWDKLLPHFFWIWQWRCCGWWMYMYVSLYVWPATFLFFHSSILSFIHSSICSFIHPLISFIHSSIHSLVQSRSRVLWMQKLRTPCGSPGLSKVPSVEPGLVALHMLCLLPGPLAYQHLPSQFILLHFLHNLFKQRQPNVWNCEKTLTCWLDECMCFTLI